MLGFEYDLVCRNLSFLTAFLVLDSLQGQKQLEIYRYGEFPFAKCGENRDLAIVDFVELTTPLASDTHRFFAFLRDSGIVDIACAVIVPSKQLVTISPWLFKGRQSPGQSERKYCSDHTRSRPLSLSFVPCSFYPPETGLSDIERPCLINLLYAVEITYDIFHEKTKFGGPGPPTSDGA